MRLHHRRRLRELSAQFIPTAQAEAEAAHPARSNLLDYCRAVMPDYETPPHIEDIAGLLERVERGDLSRLMISIPVRHGKTELSVAFICWYLGRTPSAAVIHGSYGQRLVTGLGRRIRNRMLTDEHLAIFPESRLSADSQASDEFTTAAGGAYKAVGAGAGVTGRTASLIVVDDPVKGAEESTSEIVQERTREWWTHDLHTRLTRLDRREPAIVLIGSRWSDTDVMAWLLEREADDGDQWTKYIRPAIDDHGRALWPERYPLEWLEQKRRTIGDRAFAALYSQDPTPDTGTYFDRSWLHRGTPPETGMRYYGASDYAITEDGGDYTVHLVVGIDREERMWVVDMWRKKTHTAEWVDALVSMMSKWKPAGWAEERGVILKSVGPFLADTMKRRRVYCVRHQMTSTTDKPTRARSIQARMATLGLHIPYGVEWAGDLERELMAFPLGKHDDAVDCLSLIGRMMLGLKPEPERRPRPKMPRLGPQDGGGYVVGPPGEMERQAERQSSW